MSEYQQIIAELKELRRLIGVGPTKLLTVDEVAQALAMSPKTVRNQLSAGVFPVKARRSAGGVRFRRVDLEAYCDSLGGE